MMDLLKGTDLIICFDESGKQGSDPIQLMGALSVPSEIYYHADFEPLRQLNQAYEFHWTDYNGYSKTRWGIEKLFDLALPLAEYTQMNFINYSIFRACHSYKRESSNNHVCFD